MPSLFVLAAVTGPTGRADCSGDANNKRFLGEAVNLKAEWQATPNLNVNAAFVHFFAVGFLNAAGAWLCY